MTTIPRILLALVAGLVVVGVVFAVWPDLDLAVTGLFYHQVFIGDSPIGRLVRDFFRVTPFLVLIASAALYFARRFGFAVRSATGGRSTFFLVASFTIGTALIVNLGMKDHLHRPRPYPCQGIRRRRESGRGIGSMAPARRIAASPPARLHPRSG